MIGSISQPTFFPWLGYFDIIKKSDMFVFLDNVKFEKRSWQMRNKLKMVLGNKEEETWIRIPTKNVTVESLIKDVMIDNEQKWKQNHLMMFQTHYGNEYRKIDFIEKMYQEDWEKLCEFNINFIKKTCKYLDIKTKIIRASELEVEGKKSQLLVNICKKINVDSYLSTIGSKIYLDKDKEIFEKEKIEINFHNFSHPKYKQKGKMFIEKLSILDLIFNERRKAKEFFK